jgi:uncharacterized protein YwgA
VNRKDVLLAALAAAEKPMQPVHLQKALFLIDKKLPRLFEGHERYAFQPYDYGPFDSAVYADADALALEGFVTVNRDSGSWYRVYAATEKGRVRGSALVAGMTDKQSALLRKIVALVSSLSFRQLVSAIYKSYPETKVNSVFKEKK